MKNLPITKHCSMISSSSSVNFTTGFPLAYSSATLVCKFDQNWSLLSPSSPLTMVDNFLSTTLGIKTNWKWIEVLNRPKDPDQLTPLLPTLTRLWPSRQRSKFRSNLTKFNICPWYKSHVQIRVGSACVETRSVEYETRSVEYLTCTIGSFQISNQTARHDRTDLDFGGDDINGWRIFWLIMTEYWPCRSNTQFGTSHAETKLIHILKPTQALPTTQTWREQPCVPNMVFLRTSVVIISTRLAHLRPPHPDTSSTTHHGNYLAGTPRYLFNHPPL